MLWAFLTSWAKSQHDRPSSRRMRRTYQCEDIPAGLIAGHLVGKQMVRAEHARQVVLRRNQHAPPAATLCILVIRTLDIPNFSTGVEKSNIQQNRSTSQVHCIG